ncbi:hypothetical protein HDU93_002604, partial [Gonapodya sp. JEL0774]
MLPTIVSDPPKPSKGSNQPSSSTSNSKPESPFSVALAEFKARADALGRKGVIVGEIEPPEGYDEDGSDGDGEGKWEPSLEDFQRVSKAFLSEEGMKEMERIGTRLQKVGIDEDDEDEHEDGEFPGFSCMRMTNTSSSYEALDQLENEVKKVKKFVKEKKYVKAFELAFGVTLVFHQEDFWHADRDVPERFQVHLTALRSAWRALLKLSDRELGIADGDTDTRGAAEDLIL